MDVTKPESKKGSLADSADRSVEQHEREGVSVGYSSQDDNTLPVQYFPMPHHPVNSPAVILIHVGELMCVTGTFSNIFLKEQKIMIFSGNQEIIFEILNGSSP